MPATVSIFWFRRDLRLQDNAGLYHALRSGKPVLPIFIFDTEILNDLPEKADKRVAFIYHALQKLQEELEKQGSILYVMHGTPLACFKRLTNEYDVAGVYTNHDYEPYATQRDEEIKKYLKGKNIELYTYKDQVIFEKEEVVKDNGEPYTIFTPYSRKWKDKLTDFYLKPYPIKKYFKNFYQHKSIKMPSLTSMGFKDIDPGAPTTRLNKEIAEHYDKTRDFPAIKGTTRMGIHLRFGTVSIRMLAKEAKELNGILLNELIWREFYQMILWHFPNVVSHSFKKEYDHIKWRNNEREFGLWCLGKTGYPIVDAGMRQLNETGFMHNRVRMITASFLTKHLLIDWRWGETYFAEKLLDYELASNNGNWQWAAGCGCDPVPYFRIFNPELQTKKFDPELKYIHQWVSEFDTLSYPQPIVDHKAARERCITEYKKALQKK
jgi:deoxyribodipyrimidine photo-lyase